MQALETATPNGSPASPSKSKGRNPRPTARLQPPTPPMKTPAAAASSTPSAGVLEVSVNELRPNPYQPRRVFNSDALDDLVDSIQRHGILQPLLVRRSAEGFELVAGERRLRAARRLGLEKVPVVLNQSPDDGLLELALVENLQREDLNPIEKARAYRKLMLLCELTHEQLAQRVGRRRSSVSNFLRLLNLPEAIQRHVSGGLLSMGHARALLAVSDESQQLELARRAIQESLSVRQLEAAVRGLRKGPRSGTEKTPSPWLRDLEDSLQRHLGTRVSIAQRKKQAGQIIIEYYGDQDFERILDLLQR